MLVCGEGKAGRRIVYRRWMRIALWIAIVLFAAGGIFAVVKVPHSPRMGPIDEPRRSRRKVALCWTLALLVGVLIFWCATEGVNSCASWLFSSAWARFHALLQASG